jgi:fatty-acid peroxygenase
VTTQPIPRDPSFDSTLAFLREGYRFIANRCDRLRSDVFATRLMLQRVICLRGADAARAFYAPGRFTRRRAIPLSALTLLQDRGSVQTLDGRAHHHRKQLFMALTMAPDRVADLIAGFDREWRSRARTWPHRPRIVLHDELQTILCRAAFAWAGLPLGEDEAEQRARELGAMIEGAGSVGPRNWRAQWLRRGVERRLARFVGDLRHGRVGALRGTPAHAITWHRGHDGRRLSRRTAAVELINLLRPTVAVARYVTFAALALHDHPDAREYLRHRGAIEPFVQEVRRFYPFFPAVGGRARQAFSVRDYHVPRGTWVLLDLYGTNHDAAHWRDPDAFRPERFAGWQGDPFAFIPQGGGDHASGHRCPGEAITNGLMQAAVRGLLEMEYDVPSQDLRVDLTRVPALPASGFVIARVRPAGRIAARYPA